MAEQPYDAPPVLARLPFALLAVAVGADLAGRLTGSTKLQTAGRALMPVAVGAAVARVARRLVTPIHMRELEAETGVDARQTALSAAAMTAILAAWRWRLRAPTIAYLALGLSAIELVRRTQEDRINRVPYRGVVEAPGEAAPAAAADRGAPRLAAAVRTEAGDRLRGL